MWINRFELGVAIFIAGIILMIGWVGTFTYWYYKKDECSVVVDKNKNSTKKCTDSSEVTKWFLAWLGCAIVGGGSLFGGAYLMVK